MGDTGCSYILANLYAPNPNTSSKLDFFEKVFETVQEFEEAYNCSRTVVLGRLQPKL
jgi:hypothetical protein